jgi:hypothetical protein
MLAEECCHDAPGNVAPTAATSPLWASEVTSLTVRPRGQVPEEREPAGAVLGRGDLQPEDLAVPVDVDPGVATSACTFTTRPPSRTFSTSASAATNVYGSCGHLGLTTVADTDEQH